MGPLAASAFGSLEVPDAIIAYPLWVCATRQSRSCRTPHDADRYRSPPTGSAAVAQRIDQQ